MPRPERKLCTGRPRTPGEPAGSRSSPGPVRYVIRIRRARGGSPDEVDEVETVLLVPDEHRGEALRRVWALGLELTGLRRVPSPDTG